MKKVGDSGRRLSKEEMCAKGLRPRRARYFSGMKSKAEELHAGWKRMQGLDHTGPWEPWSESKLCGKPLQCFGQVLRMGCRRRGCRVAGKEAGRLNGRAAEWSR